MSNANKVKVRLLHNSSIPGARWCEPVDWEPANKMEGAVWADGAWWDEEDEVAAMVWFGDVNSYGAEEIVDVRLDEIRVVSAGVCCVIGGVECETNKEKAEKLLTDLLTTTIKWVSASGANRGTKTVAKRANAALRKLYKELTGGEMTEDEATEFFRDCSR